MSRQSKRDWRKRVYALVTLGLVCVVGLVAMGSMLARGQNAMIQGVYRFPVKTLEALSKAQTRFHRKDLDGDGRHDYATSLRQLGDAGTITAKLAAGELGDYRYRILNADERTYAITATPAQVTSQSLFYFLDESRQVRATLGEPATRASKVYWSPYDQGWGR